MENVMEMEDHEVHRAPRICLQNGTHGASPGEHPDLGEGDNLPRAVVFTEQYQKAWCLQLRKALLSSQMQLLKYLKLLTVEQLMNMMMMLGWRTTLQLQRKGTAEYRRYVQSLGVRYPTLMSGLMVAEREEILVQMAMVLHRARCQEAGTMMADG